MSANLHLVVACQNLTTAIRTTRRQRPGENDDNNKLCATTILMPEPGPGVPAVTGEVLLQNVILFFIEKNFPKFFSRFLVPIEITPKVFCF